MEADASIVDLNKTCHFHHPVKAPGRGLVSVAKLALSLLLPTARCDVRAHVERALRRAFRKRAQGDVGPTRRAYLERFATETDGQCDPISD